MAAFLVCTGLPTATRATTLEDKKTFKRAQKALREGDFEQAELILRELLAKDALSKDVRLALSFALLKQRRLQEAMIMPHASSLLILLPRAPMRSWVRRFWLPETLKNQSKSFARLWL